MAKLEIVMLVFAGILFGYMLGLTTKTEWVIKALTYPYNNRFGANPSAPANLVLPKITPKLGRTQPAPDRRDIALAPCRETNPCDLSDSVSGSLDFPSPKSEPIFHPFFLSKPEYFTEK